MQNFAGRQYCLRLDESLRVAVERFCSAHEVTPFMLLLAVYELLLSRLSGQHDILVGTPLAGRQQPQVGALVGFFVNTLVLRGDLSGDPRFVDLLARVRADALDAYANQDYPFDLLVEELSSRRDLSRQALFDTTFTLQAAPVLRVAELDADLARAGVQLSAVDIELPRAKFDLSAVVAFDAQCLAISFDYSTDLFDATTIERFAGYYANLLAAAVAQPERRISALPMLGAAERQLLLDQFSGSGKTYPELLQGCEDLSARIARQAQLRPKQIAVTCEDASITYAELDKRANRLAHHLAALGVGAETPVVLCLERSIDMIVAILGVLKAGGFYVPIEPGLPDERIHYQIGDCGARCVITHRSVTARLPGAANAAAPVVCFDRDAAALAARPARAPGVAINVGQLAYVIYTSGSTGKPKGVQLAHANVLRLFAACAEHFSFDEHQVWTLFHSYAFDFSIWEIFGALLYGGRLVIVPQSVTRSPQAFCALLAEQQVTLLSQTPSAFVRLLETTQSGVDPGWARALRYVVFGGEALEYASLRPWYRGQLNPATHIINMYGITETTVHVTWRAVTESDVEDGGGRSIGRPLADLRSYILDEHLEPVPIGVTGELFIGGAGLARGYLNRPALTAERFIPDPFGATAGHSGARLYRTGDLARWRADGELDYQGRIDHQVKIHGYRIELGEIEAALARHASVTSCVVMAIRDQRTLQDRLVAYYCANETLTATVLRAYLGQTLPEYMIPGAFVQAPVMPLTVNGKVDRQKLQSSFGAITERPQLDVPYVAPSTPMEIQLAKIWGEVLGVDRVGLQDNFFDLGGDSFSAYRLMARVSDEVDRSLPLEAIFRLQTIEAFAAELLKEASEREDTSLVLIERGAPGRRPFFCVHPAGGDVIGFQQLAKSLGPEQPFYGIQSTPRALGEERRNTLEEMAAEYLKDIRSVQPHGPYLLGGHSMGGKVVYEIARQVEQAGEQVGVLAIFDTDIIKREESMIDAMMLINEAFQLGLKRENLVGRDEKYLLEYVLTVGKKRFARILDMAYQMNVLPRGFKTRDAEIFLARIAGNVHISDAYAPQPIHAPISLFLASEMPEGALEIDVDSWRRMALGLIEIRHVPGNHLTMVSQPHVRELAAQVAALIARVGTDG